MTWRMDLRGHSAVVTGGTRNIGLAIAEGLRHHGARVCIVGGTDQAALDRALERLGGESDAVTGLLASVAYEHAVEAIFDHAEARLGPVTILVNGAASRPHAPLVDITRVQWQEVVDVILTGAFLTAQQLFRRLPADRCGAIINLGGLSAHVPKVERPHVIAAKAGLVGLTRALAEEGVGRVRANCVVPGTIETERKPGQSNPTAQEKGSGRPVGTSEAVARAVLSLADPADGYVTGQTLHVNGGRYMP
ncbi:SDR family oxidoreductase [Halomonas sp. PGE1]|uniref:SDR family NAD(P)-dependent oxidoreductase n=1 Tax=Halomonas sp. PGE1 TaxID=2730360 RepID=UPI0014738E67|nr:SDR family oxidoreductase [Halomonas sp. PGE1]QJQ97809.1 SDR family oxidoreductase [Halomonas sp. PGE1]